MVSLAEFLLVVRNSYIIRPYIRHLSTGARKISMSFYQHCAQPLAPEVGQPSDPSLFSRTCQKGFRTRILEGQLGSDASELDFGEGLGGGNPANQRRGKMEICEH